jgi:hypothetical protein
LLGSPSPGGGDRAGRVREIGRLLGVLAFLEGAVRDALEQLGVMLQGADVAPSHIVRCVAEVVVAERLQSSSIASISAFLETKAASACSCDLALWFRILGLILVAPSG